MKLGDPDGRGRYGYIEETADGLLCHECGNHYRSLAAHAYRSHGLTADEYRVEHGIPQRITLIAGDMKDALSKASTQRIGSAGWEKLVEKRDPSAAAHARAPESFLRRGEDKARQIETAKKNIAGARKPITRRCKVCDNLILGRKGRDTCSPLCARIHTYENKAKAPAETWERMHTEGESWSAIGRAYGVTHTNVRNTVLRYRAHLQDVGYLRSHGPGELPEKRLEA